jgi:hypothetical protein
MCNKKIYNISYLLSVYTMNESLLMFSCAVVQGETPPYAYINRNALIDTMPGEKACCIKKSNVHGRGVFASRNITRDETVTLYPCDLYYKPDYREEKRWVTMNNPRTTYDQTTIQNLCKGDYTYNCIADAGMKFIGDPRYVDDAWFLGHMINDAAQISTSAAKTNYGMAIAVYETCSKAKANVRFKELTGSRGQLYAVACTSTKNIAEGDELFISYECAYWLSKLH